MNAPEEKPITPAITDFTKPVYTLAEISTKRRHLLQVIGRSKQGSAEEDKALKALAEIDNGLAVRTEVPAKRITMTKKQQRILGILPPITDDKPRET